MSPELVLVDPELRRGYLVEAADCLNPCDESGREAVASLTVRSVTNRSGRTSLVMLFVAAGVFLAVSGGMTAKRLPHSHARSSAASSLQTETTAVQVHWPAVLGATHYNVIFWRNGKRALDLWPRRPSARIARTRLEAGVYQWFVYPAFGLTRTRYGEMSASGWLTV